MCAYHVLDFFLNPKPDVCLAVNGMVLNGAANFSKRCEEIKSFC